MKFRLRLLLLISAVSITIITVLSFISYRAAFQTARKIDSIGAELLADQAETFLAKIVEDQAIKTRLKLDHAEIALANAFLAISHLPDAATDNGRIRDYLDLASALRKGSSNQLFMAEFDGERKAAVYPSDGELDGWLDQVGALRDWPSFPGTVSGLKLIVAPLTSSGRKLDVNAMLLASLPTKIEPSGVVIGVRVSLANLISEYNQNQPIKGSYTFMIDDQGHLLAAPPNARIDLSPVPVYTEKGFMDLSKASAPDVQPPLSNAILGHIDVEKVMVGNYQRFIAYRPVPGTNFRLCLLAPVSLATANVHQLSGFIKEGNRNLLAKLALITCLLMVAAIVVAVTLSKSMSRPLMEIEKATRRIADGNLDVNLEHSGRDEIASLANAFNVMTRRLKENIELLTESKADLARQLRMTKTLLETIPNPVYYKDTKGVITGCNNAFERFLDKPRSRIMGNRVEDLLPSGPAYKEMKMDRLLLSSGAMQRYEMQITDGHENRRDVIINKAALADSRSARVGLIGVITDITDQKLAEEAMRLYEQIVSATSDLMSFIDSGYTYLAVNEAYLTAHKKAAVQIIGHTIPELLGETIFEEAVKEKIDACLGGQVVNYKSWFNFPVGGRRYMDVTYYPYKDKDGAVVGIVVNSRDITRRIQLETQLQHASRLESIGNLAGGIAHDFNNILSPIIGYTELLLEDIPEHAAFGEHLNEILIAAMRAKDLVGQILAFARQSDDQVQPLNVVDVAGEVLNLIRSLLPSTIEIRSSFNSSAQIMGNATQVHQVLMNLCTNAAQAMEDEGGILEFTVDDVCLAVNDQMPGSAPGEGQYVQISISDSGKGIPEEILSHVFEPYFTTKATGKGTGMGLAVAHGIVESYGGQILAESTPGKGSQFSIFFPITTEQQTDTCGVKDQIPKGSERILLVDDEESILKITREWLTRLNYSVTTKTSSPEALEMIRSGADQFDLVITDMTMPQITGDKLAQEIMKIRPDLPIIICTGYSNKLTEEIARQIGIKAYVYKPIVMSELAVAIRKVLDGTE